MYTLCVHFQTYICNTILVIFNEHEIYSVIKSWDLHEIINIEGLSRSHIDLNRFKLMDVLYP